MSDEYRQMWADLGLGLEKHDQLLGLLNEVYPPHLPRAEEPARGDGVF
ncbi:hypothetical protein KAU45_03215 [bacterium]|nr:hypothetical protein [bacterium]